MLHTNGSLTPHSDLRSQFCLIHFFVSTAMFCDLQEASPLSTSTPFHASSQAVNICLRNSLKTLLSHSNMQQVRTPQAGIRAAPTSAEDDLHSYQDAG